MYKGSNCSLHVLYKAETAWSKLVLVEAHHYALDFACDGKELPNLFFSRKEGQIADIDSGRSLKSMFILFRRASPIATGVGGVFWSKLIKMRHF